MNLQKKHFSLWLSRITLLLSKATAFLIFFAGTPSYFLSNISLNAQSKIVWQEIQSPVKNQQVRFISANSRSDFWIDNYNGELFHRLGNLWKKYIFPNKENYREFRIFPQNEDEFLIIAVNKNYESNIYHLVGNSFILSGKTDMPAKGVIYAFGKSYVYGDWGRFLVLRNNSWERVETPIKNHIVCFLKGKQLGVLLGTRAEGIFRFDGKKFKKIHTQNSNQFDIMNIYWDAKKNLLAATSDGRVLIYKNKSFRISDIQSNILVSPPVDFGFTEIAADKKANSAGVKIPVEKNITSFITAADSTILIASAEGNLYFSAEQTLNYFNLFNYTYKIEGHTNEKSIGAAFIHLNNDTLPEIFVLNKSVGHSLYLNQRNLPFSDISFALGNLYPKSISYYNFGDINNDSFSDLIYLEQTQPYHSIGCSYSDEQLFFNKEKIILKNIPGELKNIYTRDFNKDGNLDIGINQYLDKYKKRGKLLQFINSSFLNKFKPDKTLKRLTKSWNTQTVYADFNNDDVDDIFIVERWRENKLLLSEAGKLIDKTKQNFSDFNNNSSSGALAFDYNNDGLLDLLVSREDSVLVLLENFSNGHFKNVSNKKLSCSNKMHLTQKISEFLNVGDLNNDGFTDILINIRTVTGGNNICLMNQEGKYFADYSDSLKIGLPFVDGTILGDIDNDGDLDIYGYRSGRNLLWKNNLDDKNYIKLFLRGIISNTRAIGAKVWIYPAGKLNRKNELVAYKQIGSDIYGTNSFNDLTAHFGLSNKTKYDIKVRFDTGKEIVIRNAAAGHTLIIEELTGLSKTLYLLPGKFIRTIILREFQIYLLIILLAGFTIYFGIKNGILKYKWEFKLYFSLGLINISLFWLILFLTKESNDFIKFLLAPSVLIIGIVLPNLIFMYMKNRSPIEENQEILLDKLFSQLINFTHGEWALRNLNSLQVFFQNAASIDKSDSDLLNQIGNRKETFLKLTSPSIEVIIGLTQKVNSLNEITAELKNGLDYICESLNKNKTECILSDYLLSGSIGQSLNKIKQLISIIKTDIFSQHSSNIISVIQSVVEELKPILNNENITLTKLKDVEDDTLVLIKNFELADILDNSLRNSIKSLSSQKEKRIDVLISRKPPKILIEIEDTGIGIEPNKFEKIFEFGYSQFNGTGKGLFLARKSLDKYGGRIYVKDSTLNFGSKFIIELNKGYKK